MVAFGPLKVSPLAEDMRQKPTLIRAMPPAVGTSDYVRAAQALETERRAVRNCSLFVRT